MEIAPSLYLGDWIPRTDLEGPGQRAALFPAGCSLRCSGCCNPHLFTKKTQQLISVSEILQRVKSVSDIEGISILGGEPLEQAHALGEFLSSLRQETDLSVMLYTGYTMAEIKREEDKASVLEFVDVLVDGRYQEALKSSRRRYIGSDNQKLWLLTDRYMAKDFGGSNFTEFRLNKREFRILGYPIP